MIKVQTIPAMDALLKKYEMTFPEEQDSVNLFHAFNSGRNALSRAQRIGHFTASSWIINQTREMALLTHHRKLNMWLQLGGHMEEGEDVFTAALRGLNHSVSVMRMVDKMKRIDAMRV